MQEKVYIYRRDIFNGKIKLITIFDSVDQLVHATRDFSNFGYALNERRNYTLQHWDKERESWGSWDTPCFFNYVAYLNDDKLITPDTLVGLRRKRDEEWELEWRKRRNWNPWSKRRFRSRYHRGVRTMNEKRQVEACELDEFSPKVRCRRNAANLPNSWDDYMRSDLRNNNWKKHRKTQWKDKKRQ